jgi:putative aldouronate transport system substrate-binding protein
MPQGVELWFSMEDEQDVDYVWKMPEFREYIEFARTGYENGFWSRSVLSNPGRSRENFYQGTSALAVVGSFEVNTFYNRVMEENPDWQPEWYGWDAGRTALVQTSPFTQNGLAVAAPSENPELALQVIDRLRMDDQYNMLTYYGIEGEDYVINAAGEIGVPPGVDEGDVLAPDSFTSWGWKMTRNVRIPANAAPGYDELAAYWSEAATSPELYELVLDTTVVEAEIAALSQVVSTYVPPLMWGVVDPEEGLATLQEQARAAGADRIKAEVQRQIDEFFASR